MSRSRIGALEPWTPSKLGGLWYSTNYGITLGTGIEITRWANRNGASAGPDLITLLGSRTTYDVDAAMGPNSYVHVAPGQFMATETPLPFSGAGRTYFAVLRFKNASSTTQRYHLSMEDSLGNAGFTYGDLLNVHPNYSPRLRYGVGSTTTGAYATTVRAFYGAVGPAGGVGVSTDDTTLSVGYTGGSGTLLPSTTYGGTFRVGADVSGANAIDDVVWSEILVLPRRLLAGEVARLHTYFRLKYSLPVPATGVRAIDDGDEIAVALSGGGVWTYTTPYSRAGRSISNVVATEYFGVTHRTASDAWSARPLCDYNLYFPMFGSEMLKAGIPATTVYSQYAQLCETVRQGGVKVVACTPPPRADAGTPPTYESERQVFRQLVLNNFGSFAHALCDFGGDPTYGIASAALDDQLYTDGYLPTGAAQTAFVNMKVTAGNSITRTTGENFNVI